MVGKEYISLLELEKDFKELGDRKLKSREIKIRREIKELFFKTINTSIDVMDKFEQKEMMKKRSLTKNTWHNWLYNYIPEPIKIQGMVLKANYESFKANIT